MNNAPPCTRRARKYTNTALLVKRYQHIDPFPYVSGMTVTAHCRVLVNLGYAAVAVKRIRHCLITTISILKESRSRSGRATTYEEEYGEEARPVAFESQWN